MRATQLTPVQVVQAHEWLKSRIAIIPDTEPQMCRYVNGASDEDLAKELQVTINQAKRVRHRLFGDLIATHGGGGSGARAHANLRETTRKLACLVAELSAKLGESDYAALARRLANETTLPTED